ncbi:partitioning defective 3-like [Tropilaelaps mercedesae]|uniref:Partitioning defective 3-like n=1 Tax=Tropilaelaps mercedesae TaxID=418985 RepID=A0A1V9XR78_9ACAR|nr:partitioning defective 3-like [Tropilaelaps mercedesae]
MSSMKVTVNFGPVRVIVPCGVGDIPVREVLELAVARYKKATNKRKFCILEQNPLTASSSHFGEELGSTASSVNAEEGGSADHGDR